MAALRPPVARGCARVHQVGVAPEPLSELEICAEVQLACPEGTLRRRVGSGAHSPVLFSIACRLWLSAALAVIESSGAGFPIVPILACLRSCMMPSARFRHSLHLLAPSYLVLSHRAHNHQREPG
jgi:hypothetical protein